MAVTVKTSDDLTWRQVDVETLPKGMLNEWTAMKELYATYLSARKKFESSMFNAVKAQVPAGHELKFGYRFGQLSIAVAPIKTRKSSKAVGLDALKLG